MKRLLSSILLLAATLAATASRIDTLDVYSPSMDRTVETTVIVPESADTAVRYPVVFLLNGYSGDHKSWLRVRPDLPEIAQRMGFVFVLPHGHDSWYWDSPVDPTMKFETFVATELPAYIDANYPTLADASKRAVSGFSMGGHGAMYLGLRHPDVFSACASMSGGVDIRPFPDSWDMKLRLGEKSANPAYWESYTVINILDDVPCVAAPGAASVEGAASDSSASVDGTASDAASVSGTEEAADCVRNYPAILFDCGYDDFFFEVNNNLHDALMARKIPHDYIVRPGGHTSFYWNNALDYHLAFFRTHFAR